MGYIVFTDQNGNEDFYGDEASYQKYLRSIGQPHRKNGRYIPQSEIDEADEHGL